MPRQTLSRVEDDLHFCFEQFPLACLLHLRENRHRLIRGHYQDSQGGGCLFFLLSELLPRAQRITSKPELTRFFTGGSGDPFCEQPEYQPARYVVRIWDRQPCAERYGDVTELTEETVFRCLDEAISQRSDSEHKVRRAKQPARRRSAASKPAAV